MAGSGTQGDPTDQVYRPATVVRVEDPGRLATIGR